MNFSLFETDQGISDILTACPSGQTSYLVNDPATGQNTPRCMPTVPGLEEGSVIYSHPPGPMTVGTSYGGVGGIPSPPLILPPVVRPVDVPRLLGPPVAVPIGQAAPSSGLPSTIFGFPLTTVALVAVGAFFLMSSKK